VRFQYLFPLSPKAFILLIVYRPALRAKSDADIIRDARREALGLPPAAHDEEEREVEKVKRTHSLTIYAP
jgi:hypothetical protein